MDRTRRKGREKDGGACVCVSACVTRLEGEGKEGNEEMKGRRDGGMQGRRDGGMEGRRDAGKERRREGGKE